VYEAENAKILQEIYDVIVDRTIHPKEGSYTNYYLKRVWTNIKESRRRSGGGYYRSKEQDKGEIVYEISDLIYHLLVLMVERGIKLEDIYEELRKRR